MTIVFTEAADHEVKLYHTKICIYWQDGDGLNYLCWCSCLQLNWNTTRKWHGSSPGQCRKEKHSVCNSQSCVSPVSVSVSFCPEILLGEESTNNPRDSLNKWWWCSLASSANLRLVTTDWLEKCWNSDVSVTFLQGCKRVQVWVIATFLPSSQLWNGWRWLMTDSGNVNILSYEL